MVELAVKGESDGNRQCKQSRSGARNADGGMAFGVGNFGGAGMGASGHQLRVLDALHCANLRDQAVSGRSGGNTDRGNGGFWLLDGLYSGSVVELDSPID